MSSNQLNLRDVHSFKKWHITHSAAPANCLQYHQELHGSISSFNFHYRAPAEHSAEAQQLAVSLSQARQAGGDALHADHQLTYESTLFEGYPNGLDYVICFRRQSGFCSIGYRPDAGAAAFDVGSTDAAAGRARSAPAGQAGDELAGCAHSDYLAIGSSRFCSRARLAERDRLVFNLTSRPLSFASFAALNGSSPSDLQLLSTLDQPQLPGSPSPVEQLPVRQARSVSSSTDGEPDGAAYTILDDSPGPFLVRFVSNANRNAKGFRLHFQQVPCK